MVICNALPSLEQINLLASAERKCNEHHRQIQMTSEISQTALVPPTMSGCRFDQAAAELFPDFSRSRLQQWIKSGELTANGKKLKPNGKLVGGERLVIQAMLEDEGEWEPENIPLNVVYQDADIIVIDKPADFVVHPAAGNWSGTVLNALLFHFPELSTVPRAGIVHRLDKDTTGLMVVARSLEAQTQLVQQMQERSVKREYRAVVHGDLLSDGYVDAPIGRHPTQRVKMAVVPGSSGKEAVTHYAVQSQHEGFSFVRLKLETGRTHQIRVHMAHLGYPLVGDQVYGCSVPAVKLSDVRYKAAAKFSRQALHAFRLGLRHPVSGEQLSWESPLPDDITDLLNALLLS